MCLTALRQFAGRFVVAATVILFGVARIGSAQLLSTSHPLFGYEHDAYQPFPGTVLPTAAPSTSTLAGHPEKLQYPQLVSTPIDPIDPDSESLQQMLKPLPPETEQDIPSRTANAGLDSIDLNAAYAAIHHSFFRSARQIQDRMPDDAHADDTGTGESYHWRGLIAQSLFFNVIENSFRSASDDQIRILLANKPFWHDYAASMRHFNMRRWNDGDDFLVNYVGHPMQGAVSGFIEVQNDPTGRLQEISATRAYWKSRFKAFLWATAYSTHSEISPLGKRASEMRAVGPIPSTATPFAPPPALTKNTQTILDGSTSPLPQPSELSGCSLRIRSIALSATVSREEIRLESCPRFCAVL